MTPKPASVARLALFALVAMLQTSAPVAGVPGTKFDESLSAPEAPTNADLKARIREYFDVYARATVTSPSGIVRNQKAFAKWFETDWRVGRGVDTKRDLGDLSEFGITPKDDGSYRVDIANFPQWQPLHEVLLHLLTPEFLASYSANLKERGFRDHDIDVLKTYVETNKPNRAALARNIDLAESYATKVKLQLSKGQKIGIAQFLSYTYQTNRISREAERVWCVGLLDSFDDQRRRILESYVAEIRRSGSRLISPGDMESQAEWLVGVIASGEYRQLIEKQKMETLQ